jgi:hypothetical protein
MATGSGVGSSANTCGAKRVSPLDAAVGHERERAEPDAGRGKDRVGEGGGDRDDRRLTASGRRQVARGAGDDRRRRSRRLRCRPAAHRCGARGAELGRRQIGRPAACAASGKRRRTLHAETRARQILGAAGRTDHESEDSGASARLTWAARIAQCRTTPQAPGDIVRSPAKRAAAACRSS